jgi:hypothetical protein
MRIVSCACNWHELRSTLQKQKNSGIAAIISHCGRVMTYIYMHSYKLFRLRVIDSSPGFACDSVRMAAACGGKRSRLEALDDGAAAGSDEPAPSVYMGLQVKEAFTYITKWQKPATIYLMVDGSVGFETNGRECADPHGCWVAANSSTIKVHFHFKGEFAKIKEHVFVKLEQTDAYQLNTTWSDSLAWMLPHTRQLADKGPRGDDVEEEASSVTTTPLWQGLPVSASYKYVTTASCSLACATMHLLRDKRIVFQQKNGISTGPHGSWLVAPDGSTLILVFHYEGEYLKLKKHEFSKLTRTGAYELDTAAPEWKAWLVATSDRS